MATAQTFDIAKAVNDYEMFLGTGEHEGYVWYRSDILKDPETLRVVKSHKPEIVAYLKTQVLQ